MAKKTSAKHGPAHTAKTTTTAGKSGSKALARRGPATHAAKNITDDIRTLASEVKDLRTLRSKYDQLVAENNVLLGSLRELNTAIAGSAISAEAQCSRSRVAGPIEPACPDQTETESSITLAAANPATAIARSNSRSWRACASSRAAASKGATRNPIAARRSASACPSSGGPSQASDRRRVEKLTRASRTAGSPASAVSASHTQAPQTRPST
jgi:hypothetical protein